ncbi:transmembrane protein, partial [Cystoisospora suis]
MTSGTRQSLGFSSSAKMSRRFFCLFIVCFSSHSVGLWRALAAGVLDSSVEISGVQPTSTSSDSASLSSASSTPESNDVTPDLAAKGNSVLQAIESGVKDGVRFKRKKEELADLMLNAKRDVLTGNDECRRHLHFVASSPAFVQVKPTGDVEVGERTEVFDYLKQASRDFSAPGITLLRGRSSCVFDVRLDQTEKKYRKQEKRASRLDKRLRHDARSILSRLQTIRSIMNVAETEVDSQVLAMFYSLLSTKACRREGRFYRRAIRKLPGWRQRREAKGKEEKEKKKVYWKYLLSQFSVYWFTVNPRRCEEILRPSSSGPTQRPAADPRRKKCQLLSLTAGLRAQVTALTDAVAKQDSPQATVLADNLLRNLKESKPTLAELAEVNVKIASSARSVSMFLLQQNKRTLAFLNGLARLSIFRKMIVFFMKKMIRVLLPRQEELVMVGKVLLTLQDVSPFETPESFYNRAVLDMIFSSLEATVRCMVGHRQLGKVIREAFHEYARNEATRKDKEKQPQNPRLSLPPLAADPDTSPGASPSPSVSSLPSFLQLGSDPRAPLLSSMDSDSLGREEMHELGEAAVKFRDAMMQRPTNVWGAPWDEDETAAEGFGRKLRSLVGVPESSGDFRKAAMIGLWMLAASLMGLGIAAIVIFPLGTLFL